MNAQLVSSIHKFNKGLVVDYHVSQAMMFSMETTTTLEKVMPNRFSPHLHINNMLVLQQFGFRKGIHNNENAAYKLT
jgi:hypothetical protein